MSGLYPNDASMIDTMGRLLIVALFVVLTLRNITPRHVEDHIARMKGYRCPNPRLLFWIGIGMEIVGCALVLANWHPATGALLLIAFTVAATLMFHRFWEVAEPIKRTGSQNGFMSNVAIVGGLLLMLQNVR